MTWKLRGCPRCGGWIFLVFVALLLAVSLVGTVQATSSVEPQVAAGYLYTAGLKWDGTVVAIGNNGYGQCNVGGWSGITQVAAGYFYTVGLKSDGTVVAVGDNTREQCNVGGWSGITQVETGIYHSIGLKSDGTVVAVGSNDLGQCNVGRWSGITQVKAGESHTVGLKSDGTVVASGDNTRGQCNVGGWSGITQVAAGGYHSIGLKPDGTVVALGYNSDGQCNVGGWLLQINRAPVANNQSVGTNEDTPINITLTASDMDSNALTYVVVTNPAYGVLSGTAPNLTYTPAANYNGSDGFTFKVNDVTVDSNIATISITITPVNSPPSIESVTVYPRELKQNNNKAVNVTITAIVGDLDGLGDIDRITYSVADEYGIYNVSETKLPSNGVITLIAKRDGNDKDGRVYNVTVKVYDIGGLADTCNVVVVVPH